MRVFHVGPRSSVQHMSHDRFVDLLCWASVLLPACEMTFGLSRHKEFHGFDSPQANRISRRFDLHPDRSARTWASRHYFDMLGWAKDVGIGSPRAVHAPNVKPHPADHWRRKWTRITRTPDVQVDPKFPVSLWRLYCQLGLSHGEPFSDSRNFRNECR